jgi:L-asparaginase
MKIRFITTGGTFDKVYFDALSEYQVGPPGVERILQELPLALQFLIEPVLRKDSLDITPADRQLIRDAAVRSPEDRIIVTHGTDTMQETALLLRGIPDKCIVLTGAMQPAGFRTSDAVFNVGVAVGAVQSLQSGVYIAMNGRIFNPENVRKNRERGVFEEV